MLEIFAVKSPDGQYEYIHTDIAEICEYMSDALFKDYRYTVVKMTAKETVND